MVGINNLAGGFSSRDTADGVRAVITSVQKRLPTASVLLLAILPAREEPSNPLRARIAETNRLLAGMAQPGRVDVRDVGATLLEPDGRISKATMGDFLHPTRDGFAKLSQAVAPLLAPLAQ
jgi:lysophospholipase L1-like esterase